MGVYVNNTLVYTVSGASIDKLVSMNAGPQQTKVQEWDNCGGTAFTAVNFTVSSSTAAPPTVSLFAKNLTITAGSSDALSVSATNASSVIVTGSDGSSYTLSPTGGTATVSPTADTTYTAEATNPAGTVSATAAVHVIPASDLNQVQHVILLLQENHTFDAYFGMLNPYRHANGFEVSGDGKALHG